MMNHIKKAAAFVLILGAGMALAGCSQSSSTEDKVAVQSVAMLTGLDGMGVQDRYSGVVVSQTTHDVNKDEDRTVQELKVSVGQTVKKGEVLFTYDIDEMKLAIDTGKLELEKLQNTIDNTKKQIDKLTKEKAKAKSSEQLSYSIEIQTLETDLKEDEYQLESKKVAQEQLENTLGNADVTSPIDGVVQSINEKGETDDYGNTQAYIVLMEIGNYRVKGTINEMNRAALAGTEGEMMTIRSRVDSSQVWEGRLEKIDTDNPVSDSSSYYDEDEGDEMSQSTQYPFYVTLDNSEGLMMGQHVYIELGDALEDQVSGIWLSSTFIELTDDGQAYMWMANDKDKLERRAVTLGDYDEDLEEYEITDGVTVDDYVAIYDISLKEGADVVRYDEEYFEDVDLGDEDWDDEEWDDTGDEEFIDEEDDEDIEWDDTGDEEWDDEEEEWDDEGLNEGQDEGVYTGNVFPNDGRSASPAGIPVGGYDDIEADIPDDVENYDEVEIEEAR